MKLILTLVFAMAATASAFEDLKPNPVNRTLLQRAWNQKFIQNLLEAYPGSTSHRLQWLESETPQRAEFLMRTRAEAASELNQVGSAKILEFLLADKGTEEVEKDSVTISETRKIRLVQLGFDYTIYDEDGEQKSIIYRSLNESDRQVSVQSLNLSENKAYTLINVSYNGSIDNSWILVYDNTLKQILTRFEMKDFDVVWFDLENIIYDHPESSSRGSTVVIHNIKTNQQRFINNSGSFSIGDYAGYTNYGNNSVYLRNSKTGTVLEYSNLPTTNFVTEDNDHFYLYDIYIKESPGVIYRLPKFSQAKTEIFIPADLGKGLENIQFESGYLFAHYMVDATTILKVFNSKGILLNQLFVPSELNLVSYSWQTPGEIVDLQVSSSVAKVRTVQWSLSTSLDFSTLVPEMLKSESLEIETKIVYVESFDGVKIPIRLTYKKGLAIDGNRPVYMESYGGFNLMGYLGALGGKMRLEFIKRGGIVAGTGVRGGAERGYAWYEAAAGKNKIVTSRDVIACADGLVRLGYTQSERIISTGGSNGGYVVASAGLISPDSFGLVIPVNGVQDQLVFSDLDTYGIGWQDDYTNPFNSENYFSIVQRAPLEIKLKDGVRLPEFLVVNGEFDGRVNKVHSYKLKARLDELHVPSTLYTVDRAGHGVTMKSLGEVGLRASSTIWGKIFEFSGLTFE